MEDYQVLDSDNKIQTTET